MSRFNRRSLLAAVVAFAFAAPAFAAVPKLSTSLVGPPIQGVGAKAKAKVNQARVPKEAPELQVEVENVNLPTGTVLGVVLNGQHVGTLNLVAGRAKLSTTLPFVVEPTATITVYADGVAILANVGPWKP